MVASVYVVEAYESIVSVALEVEGFVVAGPVKFPMPVHVVKQNRTETQIHGFEIDLVGARADCLVLATVKSYFGSRGVVAAHVTGESEPQHKGYRLIHDPAFRQEMVRLAAERYGYSVDRVRVRLYVGKFAAPVGKVNQRNLIESWCARTRAGGGPIQVLGPREVADQLKAAAEATQYRDHAVLATVKLLRAVGDL